MSWGDESDGNNTKFKEIFLPPGYLDDPKNEILSVTKTAPDEDVANSAPRGAQRNVDPATGRETWNRKLRPRHRSIVRKYFKEK